MLAAVLGFGAFAATPADPVDVSLDAARKQVDDIQKQLRSEASDAELVNLRSAALALQVQTDKTADDLAPRLADVQARLGELGAKPAAGAEAPDVAAQRANLESTRSQIDARTKLARLLSVESAQAAEHAAAERRARFSARLGERTASLLATPFWRELHDGIRQDTQRVRQLGDQLAAGARDSGWKVWLGVLAGCVAVVALRVWAGRFLTRFIVRRVPATRLRRSLHALLQVALSAAAPGLVAHLLRLGLTWNQAVPDTVQTWLGGLVGAVFFSAFVAGLGSAMLSPGKASWRLPPLPDHVAHGMRRYPTAVAWVIFVGWQFQRLAALVNTDLATAVAINCLFAIALGSLMAHALRRGERLRRESMAAAAAADGPAVRPLWMTVWFGSGWLLLMSSLVGMIVGYVALGSFVVGQVAWIGTVLASAYLLSAVIDDCFMTWLMSAPPAADANGAAAKGATGAPPSPKLRDQAAVLLSGVCRLLVVLLAIVCIVAPFGQGPLELLHRTDQIRDGIAIGEIQVKPGAVLQALLVFGLGMFGVRALQRWLGDRFLPTTALDPGMRTSATTLLGYVGAIFVVALALSAVGLGLERIAWVASALSVGIGFGLQAVVSNFVSGLILLAERPVKVGDWVSLSGVEGDIRRINVRATEIQMGDRSTVIVPNSEFITKTVRNVTHANPLGLVQIKLPMPLDTDVDQVREILLQSFERHEDVLDDPAPAVFLDALDASGLVFNATGFVNSPRASYGVKSALMFEVLKRLREAKLPMSKPSTMVLRDVPAAPSVPEPVPVAGAAGPIGSGPAPLPPLHPA